MCAAAVPTLLALLADADPDMREASARSLGAIDHGPEVVSALERALADGDQLVRDAAAVGLGEIGAAAARAVPALEVLTVDDWPAVRTSAREALARIAGTPPPEAPRARTASDAIVAAELPQRLAGLESESERTRGISTFEIGKLGPGAAEAVPLLADLLATDRNLDVRWSAAWAFGKMGGAAAAALPALARAVASMPIQMFAPRPRGRSRGSPESATGSSISRSTFSSARFAIPTRSCARRLPKGSGTWVGRPRGHCPASPSQQVTATRSSGVERSLRSPP